MSYKIPKGTDVTVFRGRKSKPYTTQKELVFEKPSTVAYAGAIYEFRVGEWIIAVHRDLVESDSNT